VGRDTKKCPKCGRFFASVRCPRCGFTGSEDDFPAGCPACGYSAIPGLGRSGKAGRKGGYGGSAGPKEYEKADALPLWVYILTAAVAAFVFAVLFHFVYK
jgi:ssDNA-binding Zn-finger/Zn-ribbon topoisomerase 1